MKKHTVHSDNGSLGESFKHEGWEGQDIEVKSDPLVNDGSGKPIIMRFFEFQVNPEMMKYAQPTNQDLFNAHAQQIKHFLWKDGLVPYEFIEPRIIWSKKKDGYKIMVTCEAKTGVAILESSQTLQELIKI